MSYQDIVEELLRETGASRTTLRLDSPDAFFPVVAEALAPGIGSIAGDTSIDLAASPTFEFLASEQALLIQSDLLAADPAPPPELIEHYGARAQMLAPIVRDGRLVGIVSVHYAPGPREWTDEDIAALGNAAGTVQDSLDE
jgi:GAF domain-containing protein